MEDKAKGCFLDYHKNLEQKNLKGQIAVIITLVIATIFLLVIVFTNIAKIGAIKILTSQAADSTTLSLASQISTMSYNLKQAVFGGTKEEECSTKWLVFAVFIVGCIFMVICPVLGLLGVLAASAVGAGVIFGGILAYAGYSKRYPNPVIGKAIYKKLSEMSTHNALKEMNLSQIVSLMQSDDVALARLGAKPGFFFEDKDSDKIKDADEPEYNLSDIPEIKNQKNVDRFSAWYYTKRLPLIDAEGIREAAEKFITDLKQYVNADVWDAAKWRIHRASLVVGPTFIGYGSQLKVTCITCPPAPDWVADRSKNQVRVVTIDEGKTDADGNYLPDGFLKLKFIPLSINLENRGYDVFFCGDAWWNPFDNTSCGDVEKVLADLTTFLARVKGLLDLPLSERTSGVSQWLNLFYDIGWVDGVGIDQHTFSGGDHDIYDRLTRSVLAILDWINRAGNGLLAVDQTLVSEIPPNYGTYCEEGRGAPYSSCYTWVASCLCQHTVCGEYSCWQVCDGNHCQNLQTARWRGDYGTCTGMWNHINHPTCKFLGGDLYGARPAWCTNQRNIPCKSNSFCGGGCTCCSIPGTVTTMKNAYYFQGQFSWDHPNPNVKEGFTEVRQAIEVLGALAYDLNRINMIIRSFVHDVREILNKADEELRREFIYGWQSKDKSLHTVQAKIPMGTEGYPDELPHIDEKNELLGFRYCRYLDKKDGWVSLIASRYDEDRPTFWWNIRQRRTTAEPFTDQNNNGAYDSGEPFTDQNNNGVYDSGEFDKAKLEALVRDIQNTGIPQPGATYTQDEVNKLFDDYSIRSQSRAHYGPDKNDIYLEKQK